jgi:outer membrane protein OmpA-like peptidoglycan-associated protein
MVACFAVSVAMLTGRAALADTVPASDIPYGHDHPVISRFAGSVLIDYEARDYDEIELPLGPATQGGNIKTPYTRSEHVEGKVTRLAYLVPGNKTTLEVLRNYEQSLAAAGFQIQFQCGPGQGQGGCGGFDFATNVAQHMFDSGSKAHNLMNTTLRSTTGDTRHLTARLKRPAGDELYASVTVSSQVGEPVGVLVQIVETKPMSTGEVLVDAKAMASSLDSQGRVALYGIHFDTDSAQIKPESEPTLTQMARYLTEHPQAKVFVVGHTDNVGALAHNEELSQRRADAVVKALTTQHEIAPGRVRAKGLASYAPLASNQTEEGRAQNRRVELVLQ